jgi:DNA-binding CsgD family transcriptional regulator
MAQGQLHVADVRTLLRLVAELRELGARPAEWRRHLASSLEKWCGARAVLVGELAVNDGGGVPHKGRRIVGPADVRVVHRELLGVCPSDEQRFSEEVIWHTHGPNEAIAGLWPAYGASFTATRRDVVDDAVWHRSQLANERFRPLDCSDFMVQVIPVAALRALACVKLYRAWGAQPFNERDRLVLELLGEELARDWSEAGGPGPASLLAPRLRQVLASLAAGASEKEIAASLGLSTHTVHDYCKALYRVFKVHSRAELLSLLNQPRALRTHLSAEYEGPVAAPSVGSSPR